MIKKTSHRFPRRSINKQKHNIKDIAEKDIAMTANRGKLKVFKNKSKSVALVFTSRYILIYLFVPWLENDFMASCV